MEKQVAADLPLAISLFSDINTSLINANTAVQNLIEKLKDSNTNTDKVCSFNNC